MVMVQMINKLILRNPNPVNLLIASYNEETKSCMVQNCSYSYLVGIIGTAKEQYESSKNQTTCSFFCSVLQSITRCTCLNGGFIVELNALVNVLV